jgi:5-methylcytosine-specific restriction endonuclease McrA
MTDSVVDEKTWWALLVRDDFKCLHCNNENELQPAHYHSRGAHGPDNSLNNLMLLCGECHRMHHDGKLKVRRVKGNFFFKLLQKREKN